MPNKKDFVLDEAPNEDPGFEAETIEVAGALYEVKDDQGHVWAIPAENVDDYDDLIDINPFGKLKYDNRFDYHTEHVDRVTSKMTQGFVPVTRKEVGMPEPFQIDGAKPSTSIVQVMDTVMLKIPKELAERRRRAATRFAQEQVSGTEPTPEMLDRARRNNSSHVKDSAAAFEQMRSEGKPVQVELNRRVKQTIAS